MSAQMPLSDSAYMTCKRCGHRLFAVGDLELHQQSNGDKFSYRKQVKMHRQGSSQQPCSSWFLQERVAWMPDLSERDGKFSCPSAKCGSKIGSWNWAGSQCSCGQWVAPAMQFPMSKVDLKGQPLLQHVAAAVVQEAPLGSETAASGDGACAAVAAASSGGGDAAASSMDSGSVLPLQ